MTRSASNPPTTSAGSKATNADRESNARAGLCAHALFASASDIPSVVSDALPDGKYSMVSEVTKALTKVEKCLRALHKDRGRTYVMVETEEARRLVLTLVLGDTSIGLSKELDPAPVIRSDHKALQSTVNDIRKVIEAAQSGTMSYEEVRERLDQLPNPPLVNEVLALIGHKTPVVQSLAGPIDLGLGRFTVKDVASQRQHQLDVLVVGGFDEQSSTVGLEVRALVDADNRLFSPDVRIKARVYEDAHRLQILLAQAAKQVIRITLSLPRVPIGCAAPGKADIVGDLVRLEISEDAQGLQELLRQFNLDL